MRVLQIHKYHHVSSGADRAYMSTGAALEKAGIEVAYFATAHPANIPTPWSKYFPKYYNYGHFNWSALTHLPNFYWNKEAANNLRRLLLEFKPDVAHLHNIYHHLTPSILPVLKEFGVKVVMTVHDYNLLNPNYSCYHDGAICEHGMGGHFGRSVLHKCVKNSYLASAISASQMTFDKWGGFYGKYLDGLIFYSKFFEDKFRQCNFDVRYFFVPLFIQDNEFDSIYFNPKVGHFAFSGRLTTEKGIGILLEAMKLVQSKVAHLTFVGDGPLKNYIEQHGYTVLAHLDKSSREQILRQQQFIIGPSVWWDIMFYAIAEANGFSRPVIGSNIGGIPENIEDGVTGLLVPPAFPLLLAEAIDTLLLRPSLCEQLGRSAYNRLKQMHSERLYVERLLRLYSSL